MFIDDLFELEVPPGRCYHEIINFWVIDMKLLERKIINIFMTVKFPFSDQ